MRRKKDRSNGITALYERLSRDDDNAGESNSIVHTRLSVSIKIDVHIRYFYLGFNSINAENRIIV